MSRRNRRRARAREAPVEQEEGFLKRWARLKEASRRGIEIEDPPQEEPARLPEAAGPAAGAAEPTAGAAEDEPPGDEDMPPLDSLGPDSDYSAFMSPRVTPELRQKALRQLFRSPKFNITDGLDDYCEDFTTWRPLGNIVTADMKYHMERKLKEALAQDTEAEAAGETGELGEARADSDADTTTDPTNEPEAGGDPSRGDKPNEPGNA